MKLIIDDSSEVVSEIELNESNGSKNYVIKGTVSSPGIKNRNGRIYSSEIWESNVSDYKKIIEQKSPESLSEWEHPARTTVDPMKAVAQCRLMEMRDSKVYGEFNILNNNSPETNQIKALIEAGVPIGVSTRGVGRLGKGQIVEEFKLVCVDLVASPSDYNANLKGIQESREMFTESWELKDKEFSVVDGKIICDESGCKIDEDTGGGDIAHNPKETKCAANASALIEALNNYSKKPEVLTKNETLAQEITEGFGRNDMDKIAKKLRPLQDKAVKMMKAGDKSSPEFEKVRAQINKLADEFAKLLSEGSVKKVYGDYDFKFDNGRTTMRNKGKDEILMTQDYPSLTSTLMKKMIKDFEKSGKSFHGIKTEGAGSIDEAGAARQYNGKEILAQYDKAFDEMDELIYMVGQSDQEIQKRMVESLQELQQYFSDAGFSKKWKPTNEAQKDEK